MSPARATMAPAVERRVSYPVVEFDKLVSRGATGRDLRHGSRNRHSSLDHTHKGVRPDRRGTKPLPPLTRPAIRQIATNPLPWEGMTRLVGGVWEEELAEAGRGFQQLPADTRNASERRVAESGRPRVAEGLSLWRRGFPSDPDAPDLTSVAPSPLSVLSFH